MSNPRSKESFSVDWDNFSSMFILLYLAWLPRMSRSFRAIQSTVLLLLCNSVWVWLGSNTSWSTFPHPRTYHQQSHTSWTEFNQVLNLIAHQVYMRLQLIMIVVCITCRYAFAIIANLTIFGVFWGLLEKFNHSVDAADLTSDDKLIFWVSSSTIPYHRTRILWGRNWIYLHGEHLWYISSTKL